MTRISAFSVLCIETARHDGGSAYASSSARLSGSFSRPIARADSRRSADRSRANADGAAEAPTRCAAGSSSNERGRADGRTIGARATQCAQRRDGKARVDDVRSRAWPSRQPGRLKPSQACSIRMGTQSGSSGSRGETHVGTAMAVAVRSVRTYPPTTPARACTCAGKKPAGSGAKSRKWEYRSSRTPSLSHSYTLRLRLP